jgi:hypothetical protein
LLAPGRAHLRRAARALACSSAALQQNKEEEKARNKNGHMKTSEISNPNSSFHAQQFEVQIEPQQHHNKS